MLALSACGGGSGGTTANPQTPKEAAMASLIGFLEGDVKAFTEYSEPDQSFTIKELADYICGVLTDEESETRSYITDMQYAYIDCGNDGIPEMALDYTVTTYYGEYSDMPDTIHFVVANTADGLKAIYYGESYYRTYTEINSLGFIYSGGSYSAMGHYFDHSYIDANGELIFLYSADYSLGYSEPMIPYYDIDYLDLPDGYDYDWDFIDDGYELDVYCFSPFDENDNYDEYRQGYMYVFSDNNGNDATPPMRWATFYQDNGIKLYSQTEMRDLLRQHRADLGCTDDIYNGNADMEWTQLAYSWITPAEESQGAIYPRDYLLDEWYLSEIIRQFDVLTPQDTPELDSTISFIEGPETYLAFFTYNNPTDARGPYLLTEMPVYDADGYEYPAEGALQVEFMCDEIDGEISRFYATIDPEDGALVVTWYWWQGDMQGDPVVNTLRYYKAVG